MERNTPIRKPHTSTADLLTWSENHPEISPALGSAARSHQPSDAISKVVFGGLVTDEEVENLNKRKPCSSHKLKEITGSGIFVESDENGTLESESADSNLNSKSGLRKYQQAVVGMSQISFGEEGSETRKKPSTIPEVAKQRELSGTIETESAESNKLTKQISNAKNKELSGNNIFAPPPEIKPRPLSGRPLAFKESITIIGESTPTPDDDDGDVKISGIKTAKKIPEKKKTAELSGNDIFNSGDDMEIGAISGGEKALSFAKLREISGSNIFADGKVESRDYFGGVRKPPGGESSIALV